MKRNELIQNIKSKSSFLCVGLDTDLQKIPTHLLKEKDPIFEFNKQIIDATIDYSVAYKPNLAFYETEGSKGWDSLQKTIEYLPKSIFSIADAKRGDIGNTAHMYAKAFFEKLNFDSITVAPYMGKDSVQPFIEYNERWAIVLALTSNEGAFDFQTQELTASKDPLYLQVISTVSQWGNAENTMFVVGATKAQMLQKIRSIIPDHFLLVPGVGSQGGSLEDVCKFGMNKEIGLLINNSRAIIYADSSIHFAQAAQKAAMQMQAEMDKYLQMYAR